MSHTIRLDFCPQCGTPALPGALGGLCPKCALSAGGDRGQATAVSGSAEEAPSLGRVAVAFPRLEILELIGRGGMGFVFKARQPQLDRLVALKLLPDSLARDPRFAERFNREGRVLARLNHPNIVNIYDFGMTERFYFLLMEFVDGVNLRQAMQKGRFQPAEALRLVPKICEALQYAHERGVLHRDIKPANILLDRRGQVKIADFGIAKLVGEKRPDVTLTVPGAALGTPHYMAPEQLEDPAGVDQRADVYSLGVVFYEMLTGELPIGRFAAPSGKTPVGTNVDEVVFRALETDRERRYQSAGEMKTEVEQLEGSHEVNLASNEAKRERRQLSRWSILGAVLVGLSLPLPGFLAGAILTGAGRIGSVELWLALGSVGLLGLGGTLLGWRGLQQIRESAGRLSGLGLALFGTLTWPLSLLLGITVGLPMFLPFSKGPETLLTFIGRILFLLLAAGAITFVFWVIHASARWGNRLPVARRTRWLKWAFLGLSVAGLGVELASRTESRGASWPRPETVSTRVNGTSSVGSGRQAIFANFRVPKEQVVTFELLRRENDGPVTIPGFAGYAIAPDDERGRFSLVLAPAEPIPSQSNRLAWRLSLISDDGARVSGPIGNFGDLISNLPTNYVHLIEPDTSFEIMLTRPYTGADSNGSTARPRLSLGIISHRRGNVGDGQPTTILSVGSTNWVLGLQHRAATLASRPRPGEVLAYQWLKSPTGTNTTNAIRFTFTNVELRQEENRQWLAMDYATDVRGDCEEVFRVDGQNLVTRKRGLLVTREDSPPVRHQRFEWQIPDAVNRATVTELADEFAKALVGKSFLIPEGEQRPLLHFPVGATGDVSVGIGAKLRLPAR